MNRMLEGIKVIDLSRNLAAPYCTMLLSDFGAEVIKVEVPGSGDDARSYGPIINGKSGYFMSVNRGKKSVTLNLKKTEDKEKLKDLISTADVLVDNFRPGVLDRLGVTEEWVYSIKPDIIFTSITGFGQTGPYRTKAAYDMVVQGYGGLMSITGDEKSGPTRVGISIGDLAAGLYATIGIIGALFGRTKTGKGDQLDIAMLDCQVALLENSIIRYLATGVVPAGIGNKHPSISPFEAYPTKDGHMIICAGNSKNWNELCEALNANHLIEDERFSTNDDRCKHHDELFALLSDLLKEKNTKEWLDILEKSGIPCGPINTVADILDDDQVKQRNMIVDVTYEDIGVIRAPGNPVKSSTYFIDPTRPAPELGQHNEEIFKNL